MPRYGNYETGREVYRSGLVVVLAARQADAPGPETFAVKVCHASEDILGSEAARGAVNEFLARAKVQRRAASPNWAPLHQAGTCDEGAYSVSNLYTRSAQRLVAGRIKLDAASLRAIVVGTLNGLGQLRSTCERAHGAIRPSNILIGSAAPAPISDIVLCDPADVGHGRSPPTLAGDLRGLGELVHLLVLHEAPLARGGWPVPMAEAWSRLGPSAKAWHEFCNRLLDPGLPNQPPALEEILAVVPAASTKRKTKPLIAAGILALAATGVVGGILMFRKPPPPPIDPNVIDEEWKQLATVYADWFEAFLAAAKPGNGTLNAQGDAFLTKLAGSLGSDLKDLEFARVAGVLDDANFTADHVARGFGVQMEDHAAKLRGSGPVTRLRNAEKRVQEVIGQLGPASLVQKWPLYARAAKAADRCNKREWKGVEAYLKEHTDAVKAGPRLVDSLVGLRQCEDLVSRVEDLDQACQTIQAAGDPALDRLMPPIAQQLSGSELAKDAGAIVKALDGIKDPVRRVTNALASPRWQEQLDKEVFRARRLAAAGDGVPLGTLVTAWVGDLNKDEYALPVGLDPRKSTEPWKAILAQASGSIEALGGLGAEARHLDAFRTRAAALKTRQDERERLAWSRLREDQIVKSGKDLDQDVRNLAKAIDDVRIEVSTSAEEAIAAAKRPDAYLVDSAALVDSWTKQRDVMLGRAGKQVSRIQKERDAIQGALNGLWGAFPEPTFPGDPTPWQADLVTAAHQKREGFIATVAAALEWDDQSNLKPPAPLESSQREYAAWLKDLEALRADLKETTTRGDALYGLDDSLDGRTLKEVAKAARDLGATPAFATVAPIVSRVLARFDQAAALAGTSGGLAPRIAQMVQTPQADAWMVATAWRQMAGEYTQSPTLETVQAELAAQRFLLDALGTAGDAAVRRASGSAGEGASLRAARITELRAELNSQGRARWGNFVLAAPTSDLPKALTLARDAKSNTNYQTEARADIVGDEGTLAAEVRFNMALAELVLTVQVLDPKAPDTGVAAASVRKFLDAARQAGAPTAEVPRQTMLTKLTELTSDAAPKQVPRSQLGPGAVGWTCTRETTSEIEFKSPTGVAVAFHYIGSVDAFVTVTEVSVSQFGAAFGDASHWAAFDADRAGFNRGADARLGPRSWEWNGSVVPASQWLRKGGAVNPVFGAAIVAGNEVAAYPAQGRDPGIPADTSPMNYITPEAALFAAHLLRCRLPTSAEWKAALSEEAAASGAGNAAGYFAAATDGTKRTANVRDLAWDEQFKYIKQNQKDFLGESRVPTPYLGSYSNAIGSPTRDQSMSSSSPYGFDDGRLWLWPVGTGAGAHFKDLIGNVAEYVLDGAAELPADATLDACLEAVRSQGAPKLGIIGESACSPKITDATDSLRVSPIAVRQKAQIAFSDVGFRLAFSASGSGPGGMSLVQSVKTLLEQPAYFRAKPGG